MIKKIKILKSTIIIFLLFSGLFVYSQEIEIQVKFSKKNAVLIFLENLSENDENEFKTLFGKSNYNTSENNRYIEDFKNLNWYFSKNGFKSTRYFKSIIIKNDTWGDIRNLAIGLFSDKILDKLIFLLQHFEPIYDELVYRPSKANFINQLSTIDKLVKEKNVSALFTKVKTFFNSYWNNKSPLIITFYPIPNALGFKAKTYGNTVTSGIPDTYNDFSTLLSVIVHEVSHLLYYNSKEETRKEINEAFKSHISKGALYAKLLFDEATATAIGNGVVYKQIAGHIDKGSWYFHKYIDLMAKEMSDLTEGYLNGNKTIDSNYINIYIKKYESNFFGWLGEPENLMTYHTILANEKSHVEYLRSKFRYGNIYDNHEPITIEKLKKWKDITLTKIILVDRNHKKIIDDIKKVFSEVNIPLDYRVNFIYNTLLKDKTQLILINAFDKKINEMIDNFSLLERMKVDSDIHKY
ncbi:hypothetical protein GTQ40_04350 [Flavobacteriaceae bacterium R38]|nr:hypothetical protein [Flavobacteriaceae bacterium R38]